MDPEQNRAYGCVLPIPLTAWFPGGATIFQPCIHWSQPLTKLEEWLKHKTPLSLEKWGFNNLFMAQPLQGVQIRC